MSYTFEDAIATLKARRAAANRYMKAHGIGESAVDLIPAEIRHVRSKTFEGCLADYMDQVMHDQLSPWAKMLDYDITDGLEESRHFWDRMGVKKYVKPTSPFRGGVFKPIRTELPAISLCSLYVRSAWGI